ncbi:MAG: M20/M25/M40 family metallo-hydrolase [Acidobacteriia bacterium]|nr:M20/M25/M40 family metallo-hydrolase [Terriglobia bacterium]
MPKSSAIILSFILLSTFSFGICHFLPAQDRSPSAPSISQQGRQYRIQHAVTILKELDRLLSIPNVASDLTNIKRNADMLKEMLERRGIRTQLLQLENAPPAVFGELLSPGALRTVALYAHYDGQPVDPSLWKSNPWKPVLRDRPLEKGGHEISLDSLNSPLEGEWRLYARSASDDKAPIMALLAALDALRAGNIPLSVNLKLFFEGEEEAGSPNLAGLFEKYKDLLRADAWLLCDGPVHQSRRMQLYFGARGITELELTVYGPSRGLHSGHYGNWAPNPISLLADLLSSMRDGEGKIRIPHFLDDVRPLTDSEHRALLEIPAVEGQLRNDLGLAWNEGGQEALAERILHPAINFRGIQSGHVGDKTTNSIPSEAIASIDFRLVPDQTPDRVRSLVEEHIRREGFFIVHETPTTETRRAHPKVIKLAWGPGYPAARTSMDLPLSRALIRVVEQSTGEPVVKMPSLGGSVPMYLFIEQLKTPVIGFPIVNHDNNQHASDENLRLQNLWDGIEVFASVLALLGKVWP